MRQAKVLHIITGLNTGGAETVLARLLAHPVIGKAGLSHEVLSLLPAGPVAERLTAAGVKVHSLEMVRAMPGPIAALRLGWMLRQLRPAIVQGWMYHGNLAGLVGRALQARRPTLLWNMRHSLADIGREAWRTRAVIRAGARFSSVPRAIIYNSSAAMQQHAALGYDASNSLLIPNGFDCDTFAPRLRAETDAILRARFGIRDKSTVVAMVARAHPMKGADVLAEAVARARAAGHDLHLMLAGNGMDRPAPPVAAAIAKLPAERVTLVGERRDVADWLPGIDILAVASSWGEGFPNILGEAMASGVACVATEVGDSAAILDKTGIVVPPGDVDALAKALGRLNRLGREGRQMLGQAARNRVQRHYSLERVATRYAELYAQHAPLQFGGGFSGRDAPPDVLFAAANVEAGPPRIGTVRLRSPSGHAGGDAAAMPAMAHQRQVIE